MRFIFVGKTKEQWLKDQLDEYIKRLGRFTRCDLIEVKDEKITNDSETVKRKEGERIISLLKEEYVIALDSNGKQLSSEGLALHIKKIEKPVTLIVGGALGLSQDVIQRADLVLSISKMTFTNQMVRLILAEQIYRAYTINKGIEYHK